MKKPLSRAGRLSPTALAAAKTKVFCQTFVHKSLWVYGGNAPVTLNNKKYKIRSGHRVKSAIWYGSILSADAGRLSQKQVSTVKNHPLDNF